jgi:hypothetical protein
VSAVTLDFTNPETHIHRAQQHQGAARRGVRMTYSYEECLERSYKVNWKIRDVLGFADFDLDRPWLPGTLSGSNGALCLTRAEKRRLTHVEMGAYAHLFGFVEAFIAPQMVNQARAAELEPGAAFEALTNFASEEVKHMHLFHEIRRRVDEKLGFRLELLEGEKEVARIVLGKHRGAVLLLTSAIEWLTQYHFLSAMKDAEDLDPLTREIFRFHWMEEAQHARLDHLETVRVFEGLPAREKDAAIEDLIWLLAAVDGLLREQVALDVKNLQQHLGRFFTDAERAELRRNLLRAKRYCFIESGVTHPNFQELFHLVTTGRQRERVQRALETLFRDAAS